MFDEILQMVKEHLSNDPQTAAAIPPEQADAIHNEIATHVADGLKDQAAQQGGGSSLLSSITSSLGGSGNILTSAIAGGLVGKLGEKFGLNPAITGVIAASIPTIVQKFISKANDPNAAHSNVVQGFSPTA
jgi:uncharacterized protein YidB (DUF937 family)